MKRLILIAALVAGYCALSTTEAGAVVCARGVCGAGCAGPRGAVVARHPPVYRGAAVVRRPVYRGGVACYGTWHGGVCLRW
jgi:hypothetical protein